MPNLMPKSIADKIPELGTTDNQRDRLIFTKFFVPLNTWYWYPFEYSKETGMFFGLACGFEKELGYWTLQELEENGVLRDTTFEPIKWSELKLKENYLY